MKTFNKFTKNFTKDRDKAVTESIETDSLEPYKAFYAKYTKLGVYNLAMPRDAVVEISVRKIACNSRGVSKAVQDKAREWLEVRGYKTSI